MIDVLAQYNDEDFRKLVNESESISDLSKKLGYTTIAGDNYRHIKARIEALNIPTSHFNKNRKAAVKRCPENIFIENSTAAQTTLRRWFIKGEYVPYECSICGMLPEWQGKPLTLILDHINGQNKDDRLENLRWVCPNCNQQLDTTGYKKARAEEKESNKIQNFCLDCHTPISVNAVRCKKCNIAYQNKLKEEENPIPVDRETLKKEIRILPFTEVARKYNTSKKWIQNWCRQLQLPQLKRDIERYTDEEWKLI